MACREVEAVAGKDTFAPQYQKLVALMKQNIYPANVSKELAETLSPDVFGDWSALTRVQDHYSEAGRVDDKGVLKPEAAKEFSEFYAAWLEQVSDICLQFEQIAKKDPNHLVIHAGKALAIKLPKEMDVETPADVNPVSG